MYECSTLMEIATEIASGAERRIENYTKTIDKLKKNISDLQIAINNARLEGDRLDVFPNIINKKLQCPICWIDRELSSTLIKIGESDVIEAFFRCQARNHYISIPAHR
jgi:hypothetical protein